MATGNHSKELESKSYGGGTLRLTDRFIGDEGCGSLLRVLRHNDQVTELDLTGCNIFHADELSEIIRSMPSLRRLKLEWNSLGLAKPSLAGLAGALAASPTLQEVDLRSNRIGPAGATLFANALRTNTTLTNLDLRWNDVGAAGGSAFLTMLQTNHALLDLKLAGNGSPPSTLTAIEKLLERNKHTSLRRNKQTMVPCTRVLDIAALEAMSTERVAILSREVTVLKEELAQAKNEQDELTHRKAVADMRAQDLEAKLQEEVAQKRALKKAKAELNESLLEAQKARSRCEEGARKGADAASARLALETAAMMSVQGKVQELQESVMQSSEEIKVLKEAASKAKEEHLQRMQAAEARARESCEYYESQLRRLESLLETERRNNSEEVARQRQKSASEIRNLEEALGKMKEAREQALKERDDLELSAQRGAVAADERLQRRERQLRDDKDSAVKAVEERLAAIESQKAELQEALSSSARELARAKKAHAKRLEELERQLAEERACHVSTEQARNEVEGRASSLATDLAQVKQKLRGAEERVSILRGQMEGAVAAQEAALDDLTKQHAAERRQWEAEAAAAKGAAEACQRHLREVLAEQSRRTSDLERRLAGGEVAFSDLSRQQFATLRAAAQFVSPS